MKLLNNYKNGNIKVKIFDDGTRIIDIPDNEKANLQFPLSMDVKITNKCPIGCPMCHEKSTIDGKHGDILGAKFIDTLHSGTEMAIGGGAVTGHPDLIPFLTKLKNKGILPSITINQVEYESNDSMIWELINNKLIYGLGVSFKMEDNEAWKKLASYPNMVVHLIAGIHDKKVFDYLSQFNVKILILGYKNFGRGADLFKIKGDPINENIEWLKNNLKDYLPKFQVVSFDNLSIKQLEVDKLLSKEEWDSFYQGDDGTATMYVDLVNEQFAKTSTSTIRYELTDNIESMFNVIKEESQSGN